MNRTFVQLAVFVLLFTTPAAAAGPELRSIFGQNHKYDQLVGPATRAVVYCFLDESCPVAQQYAETLAGLSNSYHDRGVTFVGVYSAANSNARSMAEHALLHKIPFHTFIDVQQRLARLYEIDRKPTVLMVSPSRRDGLQRLQVLYRGAIDDQFGVGSQRPQPTRFYLRDAIEDSLSGRDPRLAETAVAGCRLSFGSPALAPSRFYEDVLPILQARCQSCHRTGESGPMALVTYDDAAAYADMIAEVASDRRMPPWPAESSHRLADDQRLSPQEIDVLVAWAQQGAPPGDRRKAPPPVHWPAAGVWRIGQPDLVLTTRPFKLPATGTVQYMYHVIPTHFAEDRFIQAAEVRTDRPGVVHHIQVLEGTADASITEVRGPVALSAAEQLKLHGLSLEDSKLVANYVPGNGDNATIYPQNRGLRIRKGAVLYIETHYTTSGAETTEQTEVGFVFRKTAPAVEVHTQWFYRHRGHFAIPPHAAHFELVKDDIFVKNHDVRVLSLRMHLHARGKDFLVEKVSNSTAGEHREPLLWIPAWDFNWQRNYRFAESVLLLGGQSLRATAHWDNSALNPHNPDPNRRVEWGQQTTDEMMAVLMTYEILTPEESGHARAVQH